MGSKQPTIVVKKINETQETMENNGSTINVSEWLSHNNKVRGATCQETGWLKTMNEWLNVENNSHQSKSMKYQVRYIKSYSLSLKFAHLNIVAIEITSIL